MAYTLMKGVFRITGFSPDGDSIRFAPDDPGLVNALPGMRKVIAEGDSIQLRLECIDSLETHYLTGSRDLRHQPLGAGTAARDGLLASIGFEGVVWDGERVASCTEDDQPGYILANKSDAHGSRPVAYAFSGDTDQHDDMTMIMVKVAATGAARPFEPVAPV